MTRILRRSETGPTAIRKDDIEGKAVTICMCGLSAELPYCDDSHKVTRDEEPGTLYLYARDAEGRLGRTAVDVTPQEKKA
jgi:CDGSH iron-sulfur domain-containing protein 1